jgi:hypothetical protein
MYRIHFVNGTVLPISADDVFVRSGAYVFVKGETDPEIVLLESPMTSVLFVEFPELLKEYPHD